DLEELAEDTEGARKSNAYYKMVMEVWNEVIGIRDAPVASSLEMEEKKKTLAHSFYILLFLTRKKSRHRIRQSSVAPKWTQDLDQRFRSIRFACARHSAREKPDDRSYIHGLKGQLDVLGIELAAALPLKLMERLFAHSKELLMVDGAAFPFPVELIR